jgi:hypothetical protein
MVVVCLLTGTTKYVMDILLGIALSSHLNFQNPYQEVHPHARLETERYVAGVYTNSEDNTSFYGGRYWEVGPDYFNIGIEAGVVTGYETFNTEIMPYGRAYFNTNNTTFFVAPSYEKTATGLQDGIIIGMEFLFKVN